MPSSNTIALIESALQSAFSPTLLNISDESHLHIGHAGAQSGKGHYALTINANAFTNKTKLQCHRMIFQALDKLMQSHIHALSIKVNP